MAPKELKAKHADFVRALKTCRADGWQLGEIADLLSVSTTSVWRWLQPHGVRPVATRIDDLTSRLNRAGY